MAGPVHGLSTLTMSREATFARLMDGIRDCAIYIVDPQGHVASWNAGAERIKGYTAEEIIGKHFPSSTLPRTERLACLRSR